MANICCNKYVFYATGENKDELFRLHRNLADVMETTAKAKEHGCLGAVADKHGIDRDKVSCRGTIEDLGDYNPGGDHFILDCDTDWNPMDELWEAVIAQYEGVSFVYKAEEPGFDIFTNTDTEGIYFPEKYLLNIWGNAPIPGGWYANQEKPGCLEIWEYFKDFEELADYCAKVMGRKFSTLEKLQNYLSELFDEEDNTIANANEFTAT
jgi:hypothetical protein